MADWRSSVEALAAVLTSPAQLRDLANLCVAMGDTTTREGIEKRILEATPRTSLDMVVTMRLLAERRNAQLAMEKGREWLDANPLDGPVWEEFAGAARAAADMGAMERAAQGLQESLDTYEMDPRQVRTLYFLANFLGGATRYRVSVFLTRRIEVLPLGCLETISITRNYPDKDGICRRCSERIRSDRVVGNDVEAILSFAEKCKREVEAEAYEAATQWLGRHPESVTARQKWVESVFRHKKGNELEAVMENEILPWLRTHPKAVNVWATFLFGLMRRDKKRAFGIIGEAIAANPGSPMLETLLIAQMIDQGPRPPEEVDSLLERAATAGNLVLDRQCAMLLGTREKWPRNYQPIDAGEANRRFEALLARRLPAEMRRGIVADYAEHLAFSNQGAKSIALLDRELGGNLDPSHAPLLIRRAKTLHWLGKQRSDPVLLRRARTDYEQGVSLALATNPHKVGWLVQYADFLLDQRDYQAACRVLEQAAQRVPSDWLVLAKWAIALWKADPEANGAMASALKNQALALSGNKLRDWVKDGVEAIPTAPGDSAGDS